eukprot:1193457-Prorocentrum_minimum.AAC.1
MTWTRLICSYAPADPRRCPLLTPCSPPAHPLLTPADAPTPPPQARSDNEANGDGPGPAEASAKVAVTYPLRKSRKSPQADYIEMRERRASAFADLSKGVGEGVGDSSKGWRLSKSSELEWELSQEPDYHGENAASSSAEIRDPQESHGSRKQSQDDSYIDRKRSSKAEAPEASDCFISNSFSYRRRGSLESTLSPRRRDGSLGRNATSVLNRSLSNRFPKTSVFGNAVRTTVEMADTKPQVTAPLPAPPRRCVVTRNQCLVVTLRPSWPRRGEKI